MNTNYTVGQYLVDRLRELGLSHLFSVAGDYSVDWVNKYAAAGELCVVNEVNELNAGYAADGYARQRGIGALCFTYSAGALCAVNALAGAFVERVPVVLINGTPSVERTLRYEQTGLSPHHFISGRATDRSIFEPITAAAVRLDNPDLAPGLIDYTLTKCISEQQPVYIELLQDMVEKVCERPQKPLAAARPNSDSAAVADAVGHLKARLESAARPLLWLGPEVDRLGLHEQVTALVRKLNIPFATEHLSKAVLSEDEPLFAGVFDGQASAPAVQDLVKQSDFILGLGVWLTDLNSLGWPDDLNKTALVAKGSVKDGDYFSAPVALRDVVDGLAQQVSSRAAKQLVPRSTAEAASPRAEDGITYQGFYDHIGRYVDENTIVGSDASLNYFGTLLLKVSTRNGYVAQSAYSSIGYIGPAATGICLAKKPEQRVMVFSGDGGFQMTAQCLATQTRLKVNPIIFVMDNGVYAVEQWLADAAVFTDDRPFLEPCVLHRWNYSKLSEVFGCKGFRVSTYGELETAVAAALCNADSPSLVQVMVAQKSLPTNATWKRG